MSLRTKGALDLVALGALIQRQSDAVVGMKTVGAAAPRKALLHKFGFTVEGVSAGGRFSLWLALQASSI
jgi:transketolase